MPTARDHRSGYARRLIDDELDELLPVSPAILLDGPRGVGKTTTALERVATIRRLDREHTRQILTAAPNRFALDEPPVLLDEWQQLPSVWDTVHRHANHNPTSGRFLLTGRPPGRSTPDPDTGPDRIAKLRMRPLTLTERLDLKPTISLTGLLDGTITSVEGHSELDLEDYLNEIAASGFPNLRHLTPLTVRNRLDRYIHDTINHDLADAGLKVRRPHTTHGWLRAYAAATATTATWDQIRRTAAPDGTPPAATTTRPYIELLTRRRIVDPLPAWNPTTSHLHSLTNRPKHHLTDPALALHLLNLTPEDLLDGTESDLPITRNGTILDALFESLVALTLRVYAQHAHAEVYHLRTKGDRHTIDFIIEHPNGILAIQTQATPAVTDRNVRHLQWLRRTLPDTNIALAVITTSTEAYTRPDNTHLIPLALLRP